ncbi:hypothetical protein [Subtercola boreus]|uniref:Uncharacterized protein n=1 Tax=Subtercola boreus TaxID=120213 RepID=A0A3E0W7D9_9MICO|nr:hypothetical protein [Subtercola boreus]RFA18799.1 hypothetical protein B7R24_13735 [Subtercola boreus]RFA18913.1 hypothetical protein B7R23_13725 [Subtercola boreus]RFA25451.1 hypothetical protein B7R25_13835 [Subtercola boreus]
MGSVISATADVSPLVNRIDPDSGRFLDGAWHVTRSEDALRAMESEILPRALSLIREGDLAVDGTVAVETYAAQTIQTERLGKLFEIVTTGHRFLIRFTIEEAS